MFKRNFKLAALQEGIERTRADYELSKLKEARLIAVRDERLARLDRQILKLKHNLAKKAAKAIEQSPAKPEASTVSSGPRRTVARTTTHRTKTEPVKKLPIASPGKREGKTAALKTHPTKPRRAAKKKDISRS